MTTLKGHAYDRKSILKRAGVYFTVCALAAAFQCSFFAAISPFGATPDLVLGLVAAVCLLDKQEAALAFAVGAGFIIDSVGGGGVSVTPLFFFILALFLTHFAKKIIPRFIPYLMLLAPAALAGAVFTAARIFFYSSSVTAGVLLTKIILPGFFSTLVFSLPLYFLVKLCINIINAKSKFKI